MFHHGRYSCDAFAKKMSLGLGLAKISLRITTETFTITMKRSIKITLRIIRRSSKIQLGSVSTYTTVPINNKLNSATFNTKQIIVELSKVFVNPSTKKMAIMIAQKTK
jgi:hypothetical protein